MAPTGSICSASRRPHGWTASPYFDRHEAGADRIRARTGRVRSSASQAHGKKVIVLGVDGMDPTFVALHLDELPNLRRLRDQGGLTRLGTTTPPQSPVAWSTFITGTDPDQHGLFDFVERDPAILAPISSMAQTTEPRYRLPIGPLSISASLESTRQIIATGPRILAILAERHPRNHNSNADELSADRKRRRRARGHGNSGPSRHLRHIYLLHGRSFRAVARCTRRKEFVCRFNGDHVVLAVAGAAQHAASRSPRHRIE